MIIGDPNQAIYGFSGSDSRSWQKLKHTFSPMQLPLSVCYRCPTSHIRLAQKLVPQIQSMEGAMEGEVRVITVDFLLASAQPPDLILCRFTAPLVKMCLKLVDLGKKSKVRGWDMGEGLVSLAKKVCRGVPYDRFIPALHSYTSKQVAHLRKNGLEDAATLLEDKSVAIESCFEEFGHLCKGITEFSDRLLDLFAEDTLGTIGLSTIHRAKGAQADVAYLLGSEVLPYVSKAKQDWQVQQEYNLQYVALTRSRRVLYLVPLPKDGKELGRLLNHPHGGMEFHQGFKAKPEKVIPVDWHNRELIPEFYLDYAPQVGDKVLKKGLYGWDGEVQIVEGDRASILWFGCGKVPDPPYPLWEDNQNLILASWREY